MRKIKKNIIKTRYQLNTIDEIIEHIEGGPEYEINLDECQINFIFDLRGILKLLKESTKFSDKISIRHDINEFGYKVFYCILKIPFRSETSIYTKEAYFELVEFEDYAQFVGAIFESEYSFKKSIFHSSVSFSTVDFETKTLSRPDSSFFRTIFKKDVSFHRTCFYCVASFRLASFYEGIDISYAEFEDIDLSEIEMKGEAKLINYHTARFQKVSNRITGLYLKQHALNMNDSVSALMFKKMEMDAYRKFLISATSSIETPALRKLKDKIIILIDIFVLWLNKLSNSHGNNFLKGIIFTLTVWIIFFSWFIIKRDGIGSNFIWTDGKYLKEAVNYFWLFNGIEGLAKENYVTWGCILPFFIGKIFIVYGIYQTISAFRKYSK